MLCLARDRVSPGWLQAPVHALQSAGPARQRRGPVLPSPLVETHTILPPLNPRVRLLYLPEKSPCECVPGDSRATFADRTVSRLQRCWKQQSSLSPYAHGIAGALMTNARLPQMQQYSCPTSNTSRYQSSRSLGGVRSRSTSKSKPPSASTRANRSSNLRARSSRFSSD